MTFTDTEIAYLATQRLGRLATVQPDGTLQASPVGSTYDAATAIATVDIGGFDMAAIRKYRNVADNGRVPTALSSPVKLSCACDADVSAPMGPDVRFGAHPKPHHLRRGPRAPPSHGALLPPLGMPKFASSTVPASSRTGPWNEIDDSADT
ncbi:MAG: pyridoxamine 5'-phosphate oxidase family protein [Actinomycetota bacterium]|nr:pyridoxamine 5'-phosphate oxidase family protein [Actinomycetota bacterium]